jgi:hypothetical protein
LRSRGEEVRNYFYSTSVNQNTINQRELIFDCNLKVVANNFWTGTGARNSQKALDFCYYSHSMGNIGNDKYNSHDQFFTLLINYGIIELILFLTMLIVLLYYTKGFNFGLIFILSSILIMLSESILERQMGTYFFVLFSLLFLSFNKKNMNRVDVIAKI